MTRQDTITEHDVADHVPASMRKYFQDCRLFAHRSVLNRIVLSTPRGPGRRAGYRIYIDRPDLRGRINISLGPGTGTVHIDTKGPINLDLRMWRRSSLRIGAGTTINNARIVCDESDVVVGRDGLWSDDILIQSNDQHGIVDLETMQVINRHRRHTVIGDHVWIGRRALVMPDVEIGPGAILAAGAILTTDMPASCIFAGVPARMVRNNVTWSRETSGFSAAETAALGDLFGPGSAEGEA